MKGVILVNLGSPESPEVKDVKKYLDEFLMDKRVIDKSYLLRALLVKGIIIPNRAENSSNAYKKVWTKDGSPLVVISESLTKKVAGNEEIPVELAMRYGKPSLKSAIDKLNAKGVDEILTIPLYPQYAMSSTETVNEKVKEICKKHYPNIKLDFFKSFYDDKDYVNISAKNMMENMEGKNFDYVLFSYHGLPVRHIKNSDITKKHCLSDKSCCDTPSKAHEFCYRHQCLDTTKSIVKISGLKEGAYSNSFQSRLGKEEWLLPNTEHVLKELAEKGVKRLAIITPAFVSDCLETLEEISMAGKEIFIKNGGDHLELIPCVNDRDDWALLVNKWISEWK